MVRWLHTIAAIALWSFLLVGMLGLFDAAVIAMRHGWLGGPGPSGLLATLVPSFTLHGWFGLVTATLVALPLLQLARRRPDAHRAVSAQAIAAALSVVLMIWVGSLVHEAPVGRWWGEHVGASWLPLLVGALGLTVLLTRPLGRVMGALMGGRWWPLAMLLAVVIATTWQWPDHADLARRQSVGDTVTSPADAGAPNVLMVSIDALRRDKLTCIDAAAPATPHLDGLAARGHLFTNAWSVSGWTLPAMAAVMTGLPPRILGVERSLGLPEAVPTVAEGAWGAGWWTAGLVANPYLGEEFGFARGFAEFDHTDVIESLRPARRTHLARELNRYLVERTDLTDGRRLVAQASRWLRDYDRDQPFFYWIHLMDPHMPYRSHPDGEGHAPALPEHDLLDRDRFDDTAGLRQALPAVPATVLDAVEELYDGEVRYADACVGELLAALEASGHADRTWIIVFSDHGEEFFEHGGFEHGHSLLPEVSGVPLLICPPGGLPAPVRDERAVSLLDVAPSLCAALGWSPPPALPGKPCLLVDQLDAACTPAGLTILENMLYGPAQQAVLSWPEFRVVELESGASRWYDLGADPAAAAPVAAPADSADLRQLARELVAEWDDHAEALNTLQRDPAELSDTARRRLRSLGY